MYKFFTTNCSQADLSIQEVEIHDQNEECAHDICVVQKAKKVQNWKQGQIQNFQDSCPPALEQYFQSNNVFINFGRRVYFLVYPAVNPAENNKVETDENRVCEPQ